MMMTIFFEVRMSGREGQERAICLFSCCLYPRNDNQTQEMIVLFPFANLDEDGTKVEDSSVPQSV
jgi:hypothetical protein